MDRSHIIAETSLRVLQIIPKLDGGGAEAATLEITRALKSKGHDAFIASEGGRLEREIKQAGGEIFHLPVASKNPLTIWRNIRRLKKLCRAMNVNLIHARSRAPAWSAYFAARQLGIAFITTYHSKVHAKPKAKVFYNAIMTRGAAVIANSRYTASQIAQIHKTPQDKIHIVPRGCDADYFNPENIMQAERAALRAQWQADEDTFVVLCPARLTAWKGQDLLIEAFGDLMVAEPRTKAKLVLVGDAQGRTAYQKHLENRITEKGLTNRVIFTGHVTNMPQVYAAADITVLPSRKPEPFGRTAIEAQAAGCPVIASDEGGFCETVLTEAEGAAHGWRVPANRLDTLTQALQEALHTPQAERVEKGQKARQFIATTFTLDNMCAQTINIYQLVMKNHVAS